MDLQNLTLHKTRLRLETQRLTMPKEINDLEANNHFAIAGSTRQASDA